MGAAPSTPPKTSDDSLSLLQGQEECKVVMLVRMDLRMGKGKIAAQCGHAVLGLERKVLKKMAARDSIKCRYQRWRDAGERLVALKVPNLEVLTCLVMQAEQQGLLTCTIADAGRTQIQAGSITVAAVGPATDGDLEAITGNLGLL